MSLIERAKRIIMQPKQEWQVIDTETPTVQSLYTGYIIPLSLAQIVAGVIGMAVFGISMPFLGKIHMPIGPLLSGAVVRFILGLIAVYVLALIIDALAPSFGATKNMMQALKVAAYSYTAAWVFGILAIIPVLSIIGGLLGLYSLYLLYAGLPVLMKAPPERALGYTVVVIIAAIILFIIIGVVVGALGLGVSGMSHMAGPAM